MPTIEERVAYDSHFEAMERPIDALDQRVSSHFVWLVGLHVTTLMAIVGALLARK